MDLVRIKPVKTGPLFFPQKTFIHSISRLFSPSFFLFFLCSIWLWRPWGLEWHRRHRVLYGFPWKLQKQRQMSLDHPRTPWQTGPPPFPQFLPGRESAVHEWQTQDRRRGRSSRSVNKHLIFIKAFDFINNMIVLHHWCSLCVNDLSWWSCAIIISLIKLRN